MASASPAADTVTGGETDRWVVVFQGARDRYQGALALAERRQLESLVTDWYTPLDRAWARRALALLPDRAAQLLRGRHCAGLASNDVRTTALRTIWHRMAGAAPERNDVALGALAGRLATERGVGLLAYSYYAHAAFAAHRGDGPKLIFQIHPHPASLRALFLEEIERLGGIGSSLEDELEIRLEPQRLAELASEPLQADGCVVASQFTARTLIEQGVAPERIRIVPYGVDIDRFRPGKLRRERTFRVIFVGQLVHRKGLHDLLQAWTRLALPDAELIVVGRGLADRALLARYAGTFTERRDVEHAALVRLLQESDVLCVPSLAEGFGHVYLEALACGTPVIGTPNSAVPDLITEGESGFTTPIRDPDALAARLAWCHANRAALAAMRPSARAVAERHRWIDFRRRLADAVSELASVVATSQIGRNEAASHA